MNTSSSNRFYKSHKIVHNLIFPIVLVITTFIACLDVDSIKKQTITAKTPIKKVNVKPLQKVNLKPTVSTPQKNVVKSTSIAPIKVHLAPSRITQVKQKVLRTIVVPVINPFKKDYYNHILAFFLLSLILQRCHPKLCIYRKILVLIIFGIFIEIVQSFIPWRSCELADVGYDAIGITIFLTLFWIIKKIFSKKKMNQESVCTK